MGKEGREEGRVRKQKGQGIQEYLQLGRKILVFLSLVLTTEALPEVWKEWKKSWVLGS